MLLQRGRYYDRVTAAVNTVAANMKLSQALSYLDSRPAESVASDATFDRARLS